MKMEKSYRSIRKGAVEAIQDYVEYQGRNISRHNFMQLVEPISIKGGTPLLVARRE